MTYLELVRILSEDNRQQPIEHIHAVADWLLLWVDASQNVRTYGSVALDPKTMNRVENPKLKVKEKAEKALFKKPLDRIDKRRALAEMGETDVEAGELGTEEGRIEEEAGDVDQNELHDPDEGRADPVVGPDPVDGDRVGPAVAPRHYQSRSRIPSDLPVGLVLPARRDGKG